MTLDLTADQRLFQSTTRDFLAETVPISTVRGLAEAETGFESNWWRKAVQLGWTAMLLPERLGGGTVSSGPLTELGIVATELGRSCAPGPFVTTAAVLAGLSTTGDRFGETIEHIRDGETIASWAVYEPRRGFDALFAEREDTAPGTRIEPDGRDYRLTGVKDRVEAGDRADVFLVSASSPDGPVQALVPAGAPGVTVTPSKTIDLVRRTARVDFDNVVLTADSITQSGGDALPAIRSQWQVAAALTAAETVGATDSAMQATRAWLSDRFTFGRPLASYQALKHRMADNKTWLEASRATANAAAVAWDYDPIAAAEAVSVAKSYVGAKAPVIAQDCVQLHGGIGVTWEHDLHLYLRRITLGRALYGTPEEHRRHITAVLNHGAA